MDYERRLRQPGEELELGGIVYRLEGVEGKGGSAIMYRGIYEDALNRGAFHQVYIKELFPVHERGGIYRDEEGAIRCAEEGLELMEFSRARFSQGNMANLELLREMPAEISGNINSFEAYGTYYSVLSVHGGEEMERKLENGGVMDLREAAVILWRILDALECFHSRGLLHLDISPDNILLTPTQALLIDYNSVWLASDIENPDFVFSNKEGYSAPEILLRNVSCLGRSTDLYSVCAVFFRMLSGRRLSEEEIIGRGLKRCFSEGFPILEREPASARHKVMQILAKGLHTLAKKRYQTVKELRAEVRELIDRIDRKGVSAAAIWESSRAVFRRTRKEEGDFLPRILRDKEGEDHSAQELQEQLEEGGLYLLKGPGGMGKTRLLTELWEQGVQKYRPRAPVVAYISLKEYQTAGGRPDYIRGALLRRLDFGRDHEHYEDARHELDKIIDGQEGLILLLDGLNESGSSRELLIKEIEELGEKPNIAILLTDRTEEVQAYALQSFRLVELLPLEEKAIEQELKKQGLSLPEREDMAQLLGNPMMLALYKDIMKMGRENHDPSAEEQILSSADGMVELYLQGLCRTQMRVDAGDERMQLGHRYVIEHLLPEIADTMAQKDCTVLSFEEVYKIVRQSCSRLQKNTFGLCFREYLGKSRVMLEGIANESEWFDFAVGELLIRDLDLLIRGEGDNYRLLHDSFLPFLAEKGKEQRKLLEKQKNRKNFFMGALGLAVLIPCLMILLNKWQTAQNYQDIEKKARKIKADIEDEKMFSALYGMRELHVSYPEDKYFDYIQERIGQSYLKAVYRAAFTQIEEVDTMGRHLIFDQSEEYIIIYDSLEDGTLSVDIYDLELQPVRQIILKYGYFSSRRLLNLLYLNGREIRFAYREAAQEIQVTLPRKKLIFNLQGNLQGEFFVEEEEEKNTTDGILESYLEYLSKKYKWNRSYATPDRRYALGVKTNGDSFSDIEIVNMDTGEMLKSLPDNAGHVELDFTYYDTYGWIMAGNNGYYEKLVLSGFTIPEGNKQRDFRSFTVNQEGNIAPQILYGNNGMVYILELQPDREKENTLHMIPIMNCSLADRIDQTGAEAKIDLDRYKNCLIPEESKEESLNDVERSEYKAKKADLTVSSASEAHKVDYGNGHIFGLDSLCVIEGREGERLVGFPADGSLQPYYNEEDQVFGFVDYKKGQQKEAYHLYSYQELAETIQASGMHQRDSSPDRQEEPLIRSRMDKKTGTLYLTGYSGTEEETMILIPGAVDGVEVQDIVSENMPKGLTYAHYIHDSELTYEKSEYGVMALMLTGYDGSCTGGDTHLVIPDEIDGQSVLSLGEELFKGRDAQWILLPYELNDIGQDTFRECPELSHVEMQDNLRIIGGSAFFDCTALEEIHLPKNLSQIYGYAFSSLKNVKLPPGLFYIDPSAFCGFEFISFDISEENDRYTTKNGVLYTKDEKTLVSFPAAKEGSYKVPERVREIGERAFLLSALEELIVSDSVKKIGKDSFAYMPITEITLPDGLKEIPELTFEGCLYLEKVVIPESVMKIGSGAFQDCPLTEVVINRDCKVDPTAFGEQVKIRYY